MNTNRHTAGRQLEWRTVTKKENSIEGIETDEDGRWNIFEVMPKVRFVALVKTLRFALRSCGSVIFVEHDSFFGRLK